jgi:hypothetical protein
MGSRLIAWEFASRALFFRHAESRQGCTVCAIKPAVLGDQAILFGLKMVAKLNVAGRGLPPQLLFI